MQRKKPPSPRQERMVSFIRDFIQENGLPPTVRDIQRACGISSTSVVDYNLRLLERDGHLRRRPDIARGIELQDDLSQASRRSATLTRVPVIGYIAAGEPLPVLGGESWAPEEALEIIEVPPGMLKNNRELYALKVKGTSMIDALVDDEDIVVLEPLSDAQNGEMVVARLKLENETTLKRIYMEGERVRLQPANSQMEPIYSPAENVEVQGKVVGVLRMLR